MEKREQDLINRLNAFEYDPDKNGLEVYEGELDTAVEISISLLSEFIDQELDKAREEGKRDATEKLRLAFHEVFFKSGELWFDYLFEDGDIEAEQDARETVEGYWEEVVSKLKDNK